MTFSQPCASFWFACYKCSCLEFSFFGQPKYQTTNASDFNLFSCHHVAWEEREIPFGLFFAWTLLVWFESEPCVTEASWVNEVDLFQVFKAGRLRRHSDLSGRVRDRLLLVPRWPSRVGEVRVLARLQRTHDGHHHLSKSGRWERRRPAALWRIHEHPGLPAWLHLQSYSCTHTHSHTLTCTHIQFKWESEKRVRVKPICIFSAYTLTF